MTRFQAASPLPVPAEDVYAWHVRPGAFDRLAPPWERVRTEGPDPEIQDGSRRVLAVGAGPVSLRWVAVHRGVAPGRSFQDVQERGPFASWTHTHRFEPVPEGGSRLVDDVEFALPGGAVGALVAGSAVSAKLRRMFRYRHDVTAADLERHRRRTSAPRLAVAITGASGLIGRALAAFLTTGGHRVVRVVRREPAGPDEIGWDPARGTTDPAAWEGLDAVVHLAGENIAGGRWTESHKRRVRASRVDGTSLVARTIAGCDRKPAVLVSASATGYYGARDGDGPLDEDAPGGRGFLAETSRAWEEAARPAAEAGVRVVHPRFGIVLSGRDGALRKMLPPFLIGAGGRLGDGRQVWSWIALDDVVGVLHEMLFDDTLEGPVNAVAPHPVDNRTFTRILATVLRRPAVVPVPAFALRVALGEMADALLLQGADVRPGRLARAGFPFRFPTLEEALRHELGRWGQEAEGGPRFIEA